MDIHCRTYGEYYFLDKNGVFYFRIITPKQLRLSLPDLQKEVRRSLKTASKNKARKEAIRLYFIMTNKFIEHIETLEYIDKAIKYIYAHIWHNTRHIPQDYLTKISEMTADIVDQHSQILKAHTFAELQTQEVNLLISVNSIIEMIIESFNEGSLDDSMFTVMFASLESATHEFAERTSLRLSKTVINTQLQPTPDQPKNTSSFKPVTPSKTGTSIDQVMNEFVSERLLSQSWSDLTHKEYIATFKIFTDQFGMIDVSDIDHTISREFKNLLQRLPKNKNKLKQYKDLSVKKFLTLDIPSIDKISITTLNKHIQQLSSLAEWSVDNGYIQRNPFSSTKIKSTGQKKSSEDRHPYTDEDLEILLNDDIYKKSKCRHSYYFWSVLIAIYTGCRVNEIGQLELQDIYEHEGIYVFDINQKNTHYDKKRIKNVHSKRRIPIHNKLIEIGLIKHIEELAKLKRLFLFPELVNQSTTKHNSKGAAISKWFGRFKDKKKFKTIHPMTFHGLRHTVADKLKNQQVPEYISSAILGHQHSNITYGTYGSDVTLSVLNEHIQGIKYPTIDELDIRWRKYDYD
jgi:integrase